MYRVMVVVNIPLLMNKNMYTYFFPIGSTRLAYLPKVTTIKMLRLIPPEWHRTNAWWREHVQNGSGEFIDERSHTSPKTGMNSVWKWIYTIHLSEWNVKNIVFHQHKSQTSLEGFPTMQGRPLGVITLIKWPKINGFSWGEFQPTYRGPISFHLWLGIYGPPCTVCESRDPTLPVTPCKIGDFFHPQTPPEKKALCGVHSYLQTREQAGWWFQPHWKIWVKLEIFPK